MFNSMKKLIEKHYYKTAEEAQVKLDVFFEVNRLTTDQYIELTALVAEVYGNDNQ